MRFCFILEQAAIATPLPLALADQLERWGHTVNMQSLESLSTTAEAFPLKHWDACLARISQAQGAEVEIALRLLQAAESLHIPTMNNSRALRLLHDHDGIVAACASYGVPVVSRQCVLTYDDLVTLPDEWWPLLVTPIDKTGEGDSLWVENRAMLVQAEMEATGSFVVRGPIARPLSLVRLTVAGQEVRAFRFNRWGVQVSNEMSVSETMLYLAQSVGEACGLDFFCLDVAVQEERLVLLNVQDFPDAAPIPHATMSIAEYILHAVYHHRLIREQNEEPETGPLGRQEATLIPAVQERRYESVAYLL
ncbi:hypothetical protein [Ktedonospora formicarum]|uniref:ATP-grasp domain-containing protein n=1 Tax=Ktedonospora formicarum TaxID=2778364 RepID=A0A8J3MSH6_9CHLR|nr:hypothetical protein [Ktedonospora formicarum]GHO43340.1 hypothetical protein KSX_15030 [Ktedonospora formicarum]